MSERHRVDVEPPRPGDEEAICAIQDAWTGARVGSEGFLLCPESLPRLRQMIQDGHLLVARRGEEIVSYITFYNKEAWETMHPGYAGSIDYATPELQARHLDSPYVLVDHIARKRSYAGDAVVRLVARLKKQVAAAGIQWFLGEIHPDNERSAAFFTRALRAERVGTLHRGGHPWVIYAAPGRRDDARRHRPLW